MDMNIASKESFLFGNGSPSTRFNFLPPPPTSIDNLPPEILTIVFKKEKLALSQLIARRAVSSQWQEIIEQHVLKLTTKLLLSNNKYINESNRLPFKAELIPLVIRLFPNLADLDVRFNNLETIQRLPELLTAFSSTLTTLKLGSSSGSIIDHQHSLSQQWSTDLATAINSLTILTSLKLNYLPSTSAMLPQMLPTFSRLQRFKLTNRCQLDETWSSITASQPLTRMSHLKMGNVITSDYTAAVLDIVATFPSLQSLNLFLISQQEELQHIRLIDIFRSLSSLEHLSELILGGLYYSSNQLYPLPSPTDQPLTSVKKLYLNFSGDINSELLSSLLVGWFPSIEKFILSHMYDFQLTTTTLRNFARLQQLNELVLSDQCCLEVELLIAPTDRPLTSLKELWVNIDADYAAGQFCSSAFVGWFPSLVELSLESEINLPLTTTILRDFSRLEHLSNFKLNGMRFEADQLHLPTSNDRQLFNVKEFNLSICQETDGSIEGRYLCSALAAWFPGLKHLAIENDFLNHQVVFTPSLGMLSEFATLEHLTELHLSNMKFTKDHLPMPTSTDRVLSNLKKFNVHFDDGDGEHHLISVLAAWFPTLEKLTVSSTCQFNLTTDLLRELGRLEYLHELDLPRMIYDKKHLQAPSSTDRPLTCLKGLWELDMAELPENFDAQYFCSTLAAWFPHLETIFIGPQGVFCGDEVERDHLIAYQTAIEANRHHFGRLVQVHIAFIL